MIFNGTLSSDPSAPRHQKISGEGQATHHPRRSVWDKCAHVYSQERTEDPKRSWGSCWRETSGRTKLPISENFWKSTLGTDVAKMELTGPNSEAFGPGPGPLHIIRGTRNCKPINAFLSKISCYQSGSRSWREPKCSSIGPGDWYCEVVQSVHTPSQRPEPVGTSVPPRAVQGGVSRKAHEERCGSVERLQKMFDCCHDCYL